MPAQALCFESALYVFPGQLLSILGHGAGLMFEKLRRGLAQNKDSQPRRKVRILKGKKAKMEGVVYSEEVGLIFVGGA